MISIIIKFGELWLRVSPKITNVLRRYNKHSSALSDLLKPRGWFKKTSFFFFSKQLLGVSSSCSKSNLMLEQKYFNKKFVTF